jgi:large subunit ribosomal protein L35
MPKIRTSKTAAKRFKVTGKGKLMRRSTRLNHLMLCKGPGRTRRLKQESPVRKEDAKRIRRLIPKL